MRTLSLPPITPQSRRPLLLALVVVLLLRSRLISAPKEALLRLRSAAYKSRLSPEELSEALQQVYITEPDGSKTILVPHRDSISKVGQQYTSQTGLHLFPSRIFFVKSRFLFRMLGHWWNLPLLHHMIPATDCSGECRAI